jgi:DNA processing protein
VNSTTGNESEAGLARERTIRIGVSASGIGPKGAREARDRFGGWAAAVELAHEIPSARTKLRRAFTDAERVGLAVEAACARDGIRTVLRGDAAWPEVIEVLTDPPETLFVRGDVELLQERSIGIVGTRECSHEGARFTRRMARELAEAGWCIVSGLARGIDAAAHQGALDADGGTAAVLGCGLDVSYPPENRSLQRAIARAGVLVSEFPPGVEPARYRFPRRNRILAALSSAAVVVECGVRSGARITARFALEQGKDVFVVPGWPESPYSAGPLLLLREGARAVRSAADLRDDLGDLGARPEPEDVRALDAIRDGAATSDDLAAVLRIPVGEARERLAKLELLGYASSALR